MFFVCVCVADWLIRIRSIFAPQVSIARDARDARIRRRCTSIMYALQYADVGVLTRVRLAKRKERLCLVHRVSFCAYVLYTI